MPIQSLFIKKLKCLTVTDVYTLKLLKFHYKIEKGKIPVYFKDMFPPSTSMRTYNTRHQHLAVLPKSKTATGSNCLRYTLPEVLLNIPMCIKEKVNTHSPQGFTNYVKQYFLNKYKEICNIENCYICNQVSIQ